MIFRIGPRLNVLSSAAKCSYCSYIFFLSVILLFFLLLCSSFPFFQSVFLFLSLSCTVFSLCFSIFQSVFLFLSLSFSVPLFFFLHMLAAGHAWHIMTVYHPPPPTRSSTPHHQQSEFLFSRQQTPQTQQTHHQKLLHLKNLEAVSIAATTPEIHQCYNSSKYDNTICSYVNVIPFFI